MTFDERLHKARMQKSRVENEGVNGATSPTATTVAAPSSNVANSSTSALTPRSNGQKKETSGSVRNEGSNNNSQNRNTKYRGAVGNNQHMYNGNEGHSGAHEQPQQQQQQRYVNYGNATGERERQPRRDNNYSKNRYEVSFFFNFGSIEKLIGKKNFRTTTITIHPTIKGRRIRHKTNKINQLNKISIHHGKEPLKITDSKVTEATEVAEVHIEAEAIISHINKIYRIHYHSNSL